MQQPGNPNFIAPTGIAALQSGDAQSPEGASAVCVEVELGFTVVG